MHDIHFQGQKIGRSRRCQFRQFARGVLLLGCTALTACKHNDFPQMPDGYREYAYITDGSSNTVTVLDLADQRVDRVLQVGAQPTGIAANPQTNEIYAVNTQSGNVSVIDAEHNRVSATIPVQRLPYFIDVDAEGRRGYVANSGSNSVSVLDLKTHREIAVGGTGEQPGLAKISPDSRTLVVTNRGSGSVSIYAVDSSPNAKPNQILRLRASFSGCPGATDAIILPDSSKTFIACSGGHQVMAIALAAAPDSWAAKQDHAALTDHMLTLLDVGRTPVHLALKPDGGEVFSSNYDSNSISEISTWTNEVLGTYIIGQHPVRGLVAPDNSTLWVANFGADTVSLYSIDDGKLITTLRTGSGPDAMALSTNGFLLLAVNAGSGDVSVIRTLEKPLPALFTMWPAGAQPNAIVVKAFTVK